jgi:hypothetical protein
MPPRDLSRAAQQSQQSLSDFVSRQLQIDQPPGTCHGARRIKARMVDYGCCADMRARLSLWSLISLAICVGELPVVVRVDVARGMRGIVVWVNVVRVLLSFFWISSRLRESCLYAGLAHGVWFPFFPFLSHATPFSPPPPTTSLDARN